MKCAKCGSEADGRRCGCCGARLLRRRQSAARVVFWLLVVAVAAGAVPVVSMALDRTRKESRAYKQDYVGWALGLSDPEQLARGVRYEYELTGADTLMDNRCAERIVRERMTEAAKYLRRHIDLRWERRGLAYELIGLVGGEEDARYLARVFAESPSEREECLKRAVQIASRRSLVLIGDNEVSRFLSEALRDRRYQEWGLKAIATYPHERYAAYVEDLIERRCLHCNAEAILAVLEIEAPYSDVVMDIIFRTASGDQRHAAAVEAVRRGEAVAVRWLAIVMADPTVSWRQKRNAVKYLAELEKELGFEAYEVEYGLAVPEARKRAVEGAAKLAGEARLPFLERAVGDPVLEVRLAAIRALGEKYDPRAAQLLIGILGDASDRPDAASEDWWEASICTAATGLGNMGAQEAIPALAGLLWAAQPVRGCVQMALTRLTGEDFGEEAQRYLRWYEQNKKQIDRAQDNGDEDGR